MFSSFFYFLFSRVNNENEQSSNLLLFLVFTLSLMNSGKRDTKKFGYFFPNYLPRFDLSRRIEMSRSGKCIETCSIDEDSTACFLSTLSNALFPIIPYFFSCFSCIVRKRTMHRDNFENRRWSRTVVGNIVDKWNATARKRLDRIRVVIIENREEFVRKEKRVIKIWYF